MSASISYKHYIRALKRWPVDLLRPEVSFEKAMRRRIQRRFLPSETSPKSNVAPNEAQATTPSPVQLDETAEQAQVNVLYSFLENRYSKKYQLSDRIMKPASNPMYYTGLMKELQEAPKRSWLQSTINKWKGFLRFS